MVYGLIVDNIIIQIQCDEQEGFREVPDEAVCGQIWNGVEFINPPPTVDDHAIKSVLALLDTKHGPRYMREIALNSSNLDATARARLEVAEAEAETLRQELSTYDKA